MESFKFSSIFVTVMVNKIDLSLTEFGAVLSSIPDFDEGVMDGERKEGCSAADEELTTATVSSGEKALSFCSAFKERIK